MSDQRFDPMKEFNNIRKNVGKAIESGLESVQRATGTQTVRVDVYELDDNVIVRTSPLDGLDPESIEVSMEGDLLTIKGETFPEKTPPYASYFLQERRFGPFSRAVTIPIPVRSEQARAKLLTGNTLQITLPVDTDRYQDITVTPTDY